MARFAQLSVACFGLLLLWQPNAVPAQEFVNQHISPTTLQVVRVEEDWRLELGVPDPNVTAPQVTTTISPSGDLSGVHAIFNLNHQALETFAQGGMQLQVWSGDTPVSYYRIHPDAEFETSGEVVTWTQVMELKNGGMHFRIENGQSDTWGTFGGSGLLTEKVNTSLPDLNHYDPNLSVENSGVVYAGNRANELVLKTIRVYTSDDRQFTIQVNLNAME